MMVASRLNYRDFAGGPAARQVQSPEAARGNERFEEILARARGRARADGFEEGVAQAEARIDLAYQERIEALERAFEDAAGKIKEVEDQAVNGCCDALAGFLSAIAPHLLSSGVANQLVGILRAALEAGGPARPLAVVAADAHEETTDAIKRAGLTIKVEARDDVPNGVARIEWKEGFDHIDLRPAIEAATKALKSPAGRPSNERQVHEEEPK